MKNVKFMNGLVLLQLYSSGIMQEARIYEKKENTQMKESTQKCVNQD